MNEGPSLVPDVDDVDYEPEMQLFKKKWVEATPDERHLMLKRLREIACPSITFLVEPSPIVSKGRPKSKMSARERKQATSTKRNSSGFEYAKLNTVNETKNLPVNKAKSKLQPQTGINGSQFEYAISKETKPLFSFHPAKQTKPKLQPSTGKNITRFEYANLKSFGVNMAMNEVTNNYMSLLPEFIWPFITKVEDVKDDGNCGYRCVGSLMGYGEENSWSKVRYDLHKEVLLHRGLCESMFTKKVVEDVVGILNYHDSPSPPSKLMQMSKMGYIIASTYKVVLVLISKLQCLTFMPLHDALNPQTPHNLISIAFVNGCHFMKLFLDDGAPIPPIASFWHKYHAHEAISWS